MPYSFFEIERRKKGIIWFLFIFLISLYFLTFLISWVVIKNTWIAGITNQEGKFKEFYFNFLTSKEIFIILATALVIGVLHWGFSQYRIIEKVLSLLRAEPLNSKDRYHQVLENVVEEASVACGGIKFEIYTIPTSALNAFSVADFGGRKVIGVTEGILSKLNRRQLQTIVGHEIAHILSGDCLSSTVAASLFELYSSLLRALKENISSENEGRGGNFYLIPIYFTLSLAHYMNYLVSMFLSRQREYQADAIAVRVTRDPLSLAEALYIISRGWNGAGLQGDRLSSIFMVNPRRNLWDEKEGFLADILSTHPPIRKRIDILLAMSGVDMKTLEGLTYERGELKIKKSAPQASLEKKWFINNQDNQWLGPLGLSEIQQSDCLKLHTWVRKVGEDKAKLAHEDVNLRELVQPGAPSCSKYNCPNCYRELKALDYEGRAIWHCIFCNGLLVERNDFERILIRKEEFFSEEIIKKAELAIKDTKYKLKQKTIDTQNLIACPGCHKKMRRILFNWGEFESMLDFGPQGTIGRGIFLEQAVPLSIDKCIWCGSYWLDHNKLEILQYIYEKYQQSIADSI